jgi:SAM-dependent methyltransferase
MSRDQATIDRENEIFWNELCGTGLAKHLNITDHSVESLRKFDAAFFDIYPYLESIVQPQAMAGKGVLEIGLGYGSVGQRLAENGAVYQGLDIAQGPVDMMNRRLRFQNLPGGAVRGSALAMPFPDATFDFVVSIGCFHHTGNVQRCLDETARVLKADGIAILMTYNKYSLRQWMHWPRKTFGELTRDLGLSNARRAVGEREKAAYDASTDDGAACPETVFLSIGDLKRMLRPAFSTMKFMKRNCDPIGIPKVPIRREWILPVVGPAMGLDIYVRACKKAA